MLNILGVHDGSILFSDLFKGVSGSILDSHRELIAVTEINNTVLLQCIASASPPALPLQTARALASRIRRLGGSDCSLMAAVTCQACSGHAHAAWLALTMSMTADSWGCLRMCWVSYRTGDFAAAPAAAAPAAADLAPAPASSPL